MDMWSVFSNVMWNIMERADIKDKRSAMNVATDEFKNILTAKAMLAFSQTEETNPHALQPIIDKMLDTVDQSVDLDEIQRAEQINPVLQELGMAITDFYKKPVTQDEPPAPDKDLLNEIKSLIQPIADSVSGLAQKVGVLEAKSAAQSVEVKPRIPAPRTVTLNPALVAKSEPKTKPGSLRDIINKSVGLVE